MDYLALILVIISSIVLIFHNVLKPKARKLPPGPFPLPIIGNLFQLRKRPFHTIEKLAKIYGPIMYLKLGSRETIIISSRDMAKEVLVKHDHICSGKPEMFLGEAHNHHELSMSFLSVGPKWRMLRRICKEHVFSMQSLEASEELRHAKMHQLTSYLEDCSKSRRAIYIGEVISVTSLNLLTTTLFSKDIATYDDSTSEVQDIRKILDEFKDCAQASPADFFPFLKRFDPKGIKRRSEMVLGKALGILDGIISERLESRALVDYSKKHDLLEVLLDLDPQNYSDLTLDGIKHLLLELLLGGASSTTDFMHWVMLELLNDPVKMSRAKNELKSVVGEKKQVVESDIPKLSYLNAMIKETFRYHPSSPPSAPHKAEANVEINGYTIPKGATIIVNVVEMHKDPNIWSDPELFKPERFLNDNHMDYKGQDFELIGFGAGRRACPGQPLAHLMLHLTIAHIIHNFDFILEKRMKPDELGMNKIEWIVLHKTTPVKVIPVIVAH